MRFRHKLFLLSLALPLLQSCATQEEIDRANAIVTALPTEVEGCTFLGDIDAGPFSYIKATRLNLKMQVAKMGGTHLVEMNAYPAQIGFGWNFGIAMTARAYKCPLGLGPKLLAMPQIQNEELEIKGDK